jgi:hypothetical protein
MFQDTIVLIALGYLGLLFAIASYGDRLVLRRAQRTHAALIYALSLGVYCTSWTFFGSVGLSARSGFAFLPIYIGPILVFTAGWPLLQRIVAISKRHNITSIVSLRNAIGRRAVDATGGNHGLGAAIDIELVQDRRDMLLDRRLGDAEVEGDLLVEKALTQHHEHPHLLRGQRGETAGKIIGFGVGIGGEAQIVRYPDIATQYARDSPAYRRHRRRFGNIARGTKAHGAPDHLRLVACRNDHHRNARILGPEIDQSRQTLGSRHLEIEKNQVGSPFCSIAAIALSRLPASSMT